MGRRHRPRDAGGNPPGAAASPLAGFLRNVRLCQGLSLRAMALRLGISQRALSSYELGEREPAHPVLERYLAAVPHLDPSELLLVEPRQLPRPSVRRWTALRDAMGYVVDEASYDRRCDARAERSRLRLTGVRALSATAGPEILTLLMRAACLASPARIRELTAPPPGGDERLVFQEGPHRHEITIRPDLACGFDYLLETEKEIDPEMPAWLASLDVVHPIARLHLRLETTDDAPAGTEPVTVAWPTVVGGDSTWDVARALHPECRLRRSGSVIEATVLRSVVGMRHAVGWLNLPASRLHRAPPGRTLGQRLRSLRRDRRKSLRDMATALGCVRHVSVSNAERGSEVAHATLRACLQAFPDTCAADLLPRARQGPEPGIDDVWRFSRDVFGLCAGEIVRRVRVQEDGRVQMTLSIGRLHRLRPFDGDLVLRHGGIVGVFQPNAHVMEAVTGAPEALTVRGRSTGTGGLEHAFRFQRHVLDGGLSFTVRNQLTPKPQHVLYYERFGSPLPPPHHDGTSYWIRFPCERLRLIVKLPRGYRPPRFLGHVAPWRLPPDLDAPRLSDRVPVPVPQVRERLGAPTASITVERPLVGFKYGLAWELA